jgi:chemotaxis signal transduction protein
MMVEAHGQSSTRQQSRLGLRVLLGSGAAAIPLGRIHQLVGFATLTGHPDEYFLGWLTLHGEQVPVFDLNRVVCDQPTPDQFGSRIIVLKTPPGSPARLLGLLAAGVTDTVAIGEVEPLNLDLYLAMLYSLIPLAGA